MKKILLFTLGLLAASTTAWADVVDFLSTSGFKAYKIQARRGPNAAGTAYDDNSGKGFMLTNETSESDLKAYANWYQGKKFFNKTYRANNLHHNFLLIKADYGTFIYSLGKNAYLATGDDSSVSFATTPTTATINTSGNDATYKYYITTSNNRQVNFNTYGGDTGVSGQGTAKDAGSLFTFVENTEYTVDEATITTIKQAIEKYTKEYYLNDVEGIKSHLGEVGYPTQADYDALKTALNTATTKDAATTAWQNFYNSVKYPEDGKAYYIEGVNRGGTRTGYVYYNGTQLKFAKQLATPMPEEAIYYCHKLGDRKYMFTTKDGKYLMYAADTDNERKGMEDTYDANKNTLTLQPMSYNASNSYTTNNDVLTVNKNTVGLFLIRGKRAYNSAWATYDFYLMASFDTGKFHNQENTTVYYTANAQTSAFKFVEAPQNNAIKTTVVKLSDAADAETYNLATYSSPFATTLPNDMKAYTVKNENGTYKLSRLNLTDQVLPANTGVILASNEANTFIPVPATTAPESPTDNQLQATSGAAVTVDAATNAYIFTKNKDNVAFFGLLSSDTSMRNIKAFKAYLTVGSNAAPRLSLNFGDDNVTTGINTITNGEQKADIIYDLSGRRVMNIQRAGIYIVNGQKRLIK
jgi:hypothetical protein